MPLLLLSYSPAMINQIAQGIASILVSIWYVPADVVIDVDQPLAVWENYHPYRPLYTTVEYVY